MEKKPETPDGLAWQAGSGSGGDLDVARRYIEQVREWSAEEAIPRLIEILKDESWHLRDRAGDALAGFGVDAAAAVESVLDGGLWYTRAAGLRVLGEIAAPRSLPVVVAFLSDTNRTIAEAAGRALFEYCRGDRSLAAAKMLHARGVGEREEIMELLRRIDPDAAARLQRLVGAPALMGAEGRLSGAEQQRLASEVSDRAWSLSWESLMPSDPLPEPDRDLIAFLREGAEE